MFWALVLVAACVTIYKILDYVIRSIKVGDLSGKSVLITGCDSGFGRALALHLDSIGFHVFAGCLSEAGQESLAQAASSRLTTLPLDVTRPDSIRDACQLVTEKLPTQNGRGPSGLWAIVNNAGVTGAIGPVEVCTQENFHTTTAINLFGPVEVCKVFLPLVRRSRGRIVNMASAMGRVVGEAPPYAVSKFGMEAVSDCLRRDLYRTGVKVSIIEPGFFKTHIVDKQSLDEPFVESFRKLDEEVKNSYGGERYVKSRLKQFSGTRFLASSDLSPVVNAYTHALVSKFPRTRYVVGLDAKLVFIPLSFIPTGVADLLIAYWMG